MHRKMSVGSCARLSMDVMFSHKCQAIMDDEHMQGLLFVRLRFLQQWHSLIGPITYTSSCQ